jgi:small subunit ribosomal protein S6
MALYEGMFLIDNDTVRAGWAGAKAVVTGAITKHGGTVVTARRWAERQLAYGIRGRYRGTFLLAYFDLPGDNFAAFQRELELKPEIMRYLQVRAELVPPQEAGLSEAELSADFTVPEPPADTPPPVAPELFAVREERRERRPRPDEEPAVDDDALGEDADEEGVPVLARGRSDEDEG